ncbi:MAG: hypothetical protein BGO90_03545 [Legionella sp. 40-6]|nr:hypothetical protein [Legionella sp.]OJY37159.1 MAG: hypothetical protein BGO90_03545 [Legionella sp. 40-6]
MPRYKQNAAIDFALKVSHRSNHIPYNAQLPVTYDIKSWDKAAAALDEAQKELVEKIPPAIKEVKLFQLLCLERHLNIIANLTVYLNGKDKGKNRHKKSEVRRIFLDNHLAYGIEIFKIFQSLNFFKEIDAPEPISTGDELRVEIKQNILQAPTLTPNEFPAEKEPTLGNAIDITTAYECLKEKLLSPKFSGSNSSGIKLIRDLFKSSTNPISTLMQIKAITQKKINKNSFSYTLSHFTFFGLTKGRHEQIEKLYEMFSQLPASTHFSLESARSQDYLNRKIELLNAYIEQHEFTFSPKF